MKIEITGNKCITCRKYTQYYRKCISPDSYGEIEPIDCGYCGQRSKNVRPGDRCRDYSEQSNIYSAVPVKAQA